MTTLAHDADGALPTCASVLTADLIEPSAHEPELLGIAAEVVTVVEIEMIDLDALGSF